MKQSIQWCELELKKKQIIGTSSVRERPEGFTCHVFVSVILQYTLLVNISSVSIEVLPVPPFRTSNLLYAQQLHGMYCINQKMLNVLLLLFKEYFLD